MAYLALVFLVAATVLLVACSPSQTVECDALSGAAQDNCYFEEATLALDASRCAAIASDALRQSCIGEIGAETSNLATCAQAQGLPADYCRSRIALATHDVTLCESIASHSWRSTCLRGIAVTAANETLCNRVTPVQQRDSCFAEFATAHNSTRSCAFVTHPDDRDRCIFKLAVRLLSPDACTLLESPDAMNTCYQRLAKITMNVSLCANINTALIRSDCLASSQ